MNSKAFKIIELLFIFICLPLLYHFDFIPGHKSIPLIIVFIYCLIWLYRKKDFQRIKFGLKHFDGWKYLFLRVTILAFVIFTLTIIFIPESLFYIIKNKLWLWVMIMIFYPLWSAYPQELIYRSYFFERYSSLFPNPKALVIINALLFGYLHFVFGNWVAVVGGTFIGFVWAYTYQKHQSLLAVAIEHAFVGNLIFTIGLGQYFYVLDF